MTLSLKRWFRENSRSEKMFIISTFLILPAIITAASTSGVFAGKPKETELKTDVISATIYMGQAQIKRSGTVALKAGQVRIFCDDLPSKFKPSSLQVEGSGSAKVSIVGTDVIRMQDDPAETPKYRELMMKLEALETRRDSIASETNALQMRLGFVEQLGKLPMQQNQAEEFPSEIFQVDGWKALMDFLQSERTGASAKIYALGKKMRKVEEDIAWIYRELGIFQRGARSGTRVAIDCAVESAGELTLELAYLIQGTDWTPEYRISFDPEGKQVILVYNARLHQRTGEDWKDVDVTLSTAMPHAGAAPPDMIPHYLSRIMLREKRPAVGKAEEPLHLRGRREGEVQFQIDEISELPVNDVAEILDAKIASSEFAASFLVPAKVDLESGADAKRIRITEGAMEAGLSLYTAPRRRGDVFVKGLVTNSMGAPILAGVAEVYVDTQAPGGGSASTFVGRQRLDTVADGQEFPLHLGVDQNIKVEHKLENREYVEKEGKKWKKVRYHYLITLENHKKGTAEVTLQDRIPVSTMKEIKVEKVDLEPKPDESRDDGIMTWKLTPAAGGKIEIRIAYTIAFPGDWPEYDLNLE